MAILTKGTQLYLIDPDDFSVITVGCATAISGISAPKDQIETTCLEDFARTYVPGLGTPGAASITIQPDPDDESHIRLHEIYADADITNVDWVLGWSDGFGIAPTSDSTAFVLPSTRTWLSFSGFIADFPFDFGLNAVVTSNMSIQISGTPVWTPKT